MLTEREPKSDDCWICCGGGELTTTHFGGEGKCRACDGTGTISDPAAWRKERCWWCCRKLRNGVSAYVGNGPVHKSCESRARKYWRDTG